MANKKLKKIISRKPFDLQEAALLLEIYLANKDSNNTITEMAEEASHKLRALAVSKGLTIDSSFRSPDGLANRLRSIASVYDGVELPSAPPTQVFHKIIELVRNEPSEYYNLLVDANNCITHPRSTPQSITKNGKKKNIKKTKFVHCKSDQQLKDTYGESFTSVYYSLKKLSPNKQNTGVTGTDIFLDLERQIKRKVILEVLEKASWSKALTPGHFIFYDKEQAERKRRQMEESLKNAEKEFFLWLPSTLPPHSVQESRSSYNTVNSMLIQKKVLSQPLLATTQIGQVENALKQVKHVFSSKKLRNIATRLLAAYLVYLREIKNTQPTQPEVSDVDVQEDWIRFDFTNASSFERTSPAYCNVDGMVIEGRSWARILVAIVELQISNKNPALETLYKKPLYANRADRPFLMKQKIEGLNCSELSNGYWININWSIPRLMEIIQAFCLHCGYNKKQVVLYGVPKGSASVKRNSKKSVDRSFDMKAAETVLRDAGLKGATVQELIDAVQPEAAIWPTKNALDENLNVIAMPDNRYVHVDNFVDLDEAEEDIGKILSTHFAQFGGYSNNQLLFGAASQELSMFLNDNDCENVDAVYAIARFLFEKKAVAGHPYKFFPPHIFGNEPDYPMNLRGLMINLARSNGGILHTVDAKNYLQKTMLTYGGMGQLLQIGSANTFLMYDDDRYILSEAIGIDEAWCYRMHDRLDDLFRRANVAYVIPRDISTAWLSTLPVLPQGLEWTHLFLQEIIDKYPAVGFKSISADLNQSHHTLAAAFVPLESPLQSFPDVVTLFMESRHDLPMRMLGEDLRLELRDAGMLEAGEMIYALPKALDDYRFAWTDENKYVYIRGNK